ncbi:hypothetical protein CN063_13255 [Sinorhizobium meliloti]|nr:hypothetical protein CN156_09455 [Sinorhizobium meliloti]RVO87598.1 hypothetical protein CN088_13865 [Sinorhizobium meliloti]RVQ14553.1 hypothetical protein CN063_13255 [Sinorhizobium meliloti]
MLPPATIRDDLSMAVGAQFLKEMRRTEVQSRSTTNYKGPDAWIVHHDISMSLPRAACGSDVDGSHLSRPTDIGNPGLD